MLVQHCLAVIGGSGIYDIPELQRVKEHRESTPFGSPSDSVIEGVLGETRCLFLPRHGRGHPVPPHEINNRANICALKMLGAQQILSLSAVGSMKEDLHPGDVVIVDQYLDMTKRRVSTFFEDGIAAHVAFSDPVCPNLAAATAVAAESIGARVVRGGTYVCIEGPQFSTRAESLFYRSLKVDVIGMTALPEAKLAREAELPYATVALVTDYDCWHETEAAVSVESVLKVLRDNADLAKRLVQLVAASLPDPRTSPAAHSLEHALLTTHGAISRSAATRLDWLIGPYLQKGS